MNQEPLNRPSILLDDLATCNLAVELAYPSHRGDAVEVDLKAGKAVVEGGFLFDKSISWPSVEEAGYEAVASN